MTAADLAAAAEAEVLAALAADKQVVVEAGWVWADSLPIADENTTLDLAERGLVCEVGTHLHLTAAGERHVASLTGGAA